MVSSYAYEKAIIKNITCIKTDSNQTTFQGLSRFQTLGEAKIYTMGVNKDYPTCWRQCDLLAAELYGDLRPMDGGIDAFLKDRGNALIIMPNTGQYRELAKSRNLKIIVENGVNLILGK
jgi:hypothetical protein